MAGTGNRSKVLGRGALRSPVEALIWRLWSSLYGRPRLYRLFAWCATRLRFLAPSRLGGWTRYRTAPKPASRSLHDLAAGRGYADE